MFTASIKPETQQSDYQKWLFVRQWTYTKDLWNDLPY